MSEMDAIHAGEREPVLNAIGDQASELHGEPIPDVTCPCGTTLPLKEAFRCLYCEIFFCPPCAETHFGPNGGDDRE